MTQPTSKDAPNVQPIRGIAAVGLWLRMIRDPLKTMMGMQRRYGPVSAIGNITSLQGKERKYVLALGPDLNRLVIGNPKLFRSTGQVIRGPKGSSQRRIRYGLVRMNGEKHRQQRELVMPPFHKQACESYCEDMVAIFDDTLNSFEINKPVDMHQLMHRASLRVSSRILFGRSDPTRSEALGELVKRWLNQNLSMAVWGCPLNIPGTPYRRFLKMAEHMEEVILELIRDKRAEGTDGKRRDVLSILAHAHDERYGGMTDDDLLGQTAVLFTASYETTANALTWTIFLLSQHPQVMADVVDELDSLLAGAPPSIDQLSQMPMTEAIIKEGLRLFPPIPFTIRAATEPTELGGFHLRSGDRVACSHYVTHHLPDVFANPNRFDPQRWFTIKPDPYEYLPFSAGPRLCIGYMFAMIEMKIAMAMFIQRFRPTMQPSAKVNRSARVTLTPKQGIPMILHPPDRQYETVPVRGDVHDMVELPR